MHEQGASLYSHSDLRQLAGLDPVASGQGGFYGAGPLLGGGGPNAHMLAPHTPAGLMPFQQALSDSFDPTAHATPTGAAGMFPELELPAVQGHTVAAGPGGWLQYRTSNNQVFYHNPVTLETSMNPPASWGG